MLDMRVCAACLATGGVRMYSMSATSLLQPYRLLTGIELQSEGMPQQLCWECAAIVHKFNKFRHKCERASLLLQDIYNQHDEVSEQEVLRVNREQHNLISSYSISPIEVYDTEFILKATFEKYCQEETSYDTQAGDGPTKTFVKVEIKMNDHDTADIKFQDDDTHNSGDIFVGEDSAQVKSQQKNKRTRKRERKTVKVLAKDFGMKEELLSQEQQMEVMRERQNTESYISAGFPCTLCCMPFTTEKTFNNHMLKHKPVSGEFICDICKVRHKTRYQVYRHIFNLHMKRYSCRSCPQVFYNRYTAQKHNAWHKGVVYTCHICGASLNKRTTYQNHLRIKHPTEHVCDQCGEQFHTKNGLLKHINMTHKLQRTHTHHTVSGDEQETSGPYCAECDIQFTCKQAWTRHVLISPKHQHERHICALGCEICGETLPDKETLRDHHAGHQRPRKWPRVLVPITCEQCGEVKKGSSSYHAHFRREHPDKTPKHYTAYRKPCICELCGKIFQGEGHMRRHDCTKRERRVHKGRTSERGRQTNECDVCGKVFAKAQALRDHVRIHTKDLCYKCKVCGQGFSHRSNMYRHKLVHTDEKPYPCDICGKSFKSRETAKSHMEYVHLKKPWPKRDRSERQNDNERQSRDDKGSPEEAVAQESPQQETEQREAE